MPRRPRANAVQPSKDGGTLALVFIGASVLSTSVAPSSPASAVAVNIGPIEAQMANHRGTMVDGAWSAAATASATAVGERAAQRHRRRLSPTPATQTNEARTAHGRSGGCATTLDTGTQSAIGLPPVADWIGQRRRAVPDRADGPLQQPDPGRRPVLHRHDERPPRAASPAIRRSTSRGPSTRRRTSSPARTTRSPSAARSPPITVVPGRVHVPPGDLRVHPDRRERARARRRRSRGTPREPLLDGRGHADPRLPLRLAEQDRSPLTVVKQVNGTSPPARDVRLHVVARRSPGRPGPTDRSASRRRALASQT